MIKSGGVLSGFLRFALPPSCISCHRALGPKKLSFEEPSSALCKDCFELLEPLDFLAACWRCGSSPTEPPPPDSPKGSCAQCADLPDNFIRARSVFPYQSPAGHIARNLKYHRSSFLADWLVELSWSHVAEWIDDLPEDLLIVPVPMAKRRKFKRGFNQSEEIARALSDKTGIPVVEPGVVIRVGKTHPQARFKTRAERRENLRGVFQVVEKNRIERRSILVVDDVMTTGSTVSAVAGALKGSYSSDIYVYTPVRARLRPEKR